MKIKKIIGYFPRLLRRIYLSPQLAKLGKGVLIGKNITWHNRKGISIGDDVFIGSGSRLETLKRVSKDPVEVRLYIGDRTSLQQGCQVVACDKIIIGNDVLIAANVLVTDHDHILDHPTKTPSAVRELRFAPVIIEDGCWLGYGCVVLKGVRIGERSVIGANAVVTKNIPPYSVAVGNPARVIKKIDLPKGTA
ncbi:MAG: acyltransferase [Thermodesulfobacteriota bacterium]